MGADGGYPSLVSRRAQTVDALFEKVRARCLVDFEKAFGRPWDAAEVPSLLYIVNGDTADDLPDGLTELEREAVTEMRRSSRKYQEESDEIEGEARRRASKLLNALDAIIKFRSIYRTGNGPITMRLRAMTGLDVEKFQREAMEHFRIDEPITKEMRWRMSEGLEPYVHFGRSGTPWTAREMALASLLVGMRPKVKDPTLATPGTVMRDETALYAAYIKKRGAVHLRDPDHYLSVEE